MKKIVALILCLVTLASVAVIGASAAHDWSAEVGLFNGVEAANTRSVILDKSGNKAEVYFWKFDDLNRYYEVTPSEKFESKYITVYGGKVDNNGSTAYLTIDPKFPDIIGVVTVKVPVNVKCYSWSTTEGDYVFDGEGEVVVTLKIESICNHLNSDFENGKWITLRKPSLFNEGVEQYFCPDCGALLLVRQTSALINRNPSVTVKVIAAAVSLVKDIFAKLSSLFGK